MFNRYFLFAICILLPAGLRFLSYRGCDIRRYSPGVCSTGRARIADRDEFVQVVTDHHRIAVGAGGYCRAERSGDLLITKHVE